MVEYIDRKATLALFQDIDPAGNHALYMDEIRADIQAIPAADVVERKTGRNVATEYDDCDQFVCSECGIELQDWRRVERDEDDGDITYHEYRLRFCPNCGAKIEES